MSSDWQDKVTKKESYLNMTLQQIIEQTNKQTKTTIPSSWWPMIGEHEMIAFETRANKVIWKVGASYPVLFIS